MRTPGEDLEIQTVPSLKTTLYRISSCFMPSVSQFEVYRLLVWLLFRRAHLMSMGKSTLRGLHEFHSSLISPHPRRLVPGKSLASDWSKKSWHNLMRNSASERVCDSTLTTRHSIDNMIDEQEIPGASDKAEDAPSLHASRFPERPRKPIQRYTKSQL
jgi:hypothetical protein